MQAQAQHRRLGREARRVCVLLPPHATKRVVHAHLRCLGAGRARPYGAPHPRAKRRSRHCGGQCGGHWGWGLRRRNGALPGWRCLHNRGPSSRSSRGSVTARPCSTQSGSLQARDGAARATVPPRRRRAVVACMDARGCMEMSAIRIAARCFSLCDGIRINPKHAHGETPTALHGRVTPELRFIVHALCGTKPLEQAETRSSLSGKSGTWMLVPHRGRKLPLVWFVRSA